MQIVIDIPDGLMTQIGKIQNGSMTAGNLLDCIKNGTQLPEGHGRLGDLDELESRISGFVENDKAYVGEKTLARERFILDGIKGTRTIIEADKEGENGN